MPEKDEPAPEGSSEDRFQKIRAELEAMKLPDLDEADLHGRIPEDLSRSRLPDVPEIDSITSKAWDTKARYEAKKKETAKQQHLEQESAKGLGIGLTVAYMIVGLPMAGVAVGWVIDILLKTVLFKGLGALIGATLGVVLAIMQINRSNPKS